MSEEQAEQQAGGAQMDWGCGTYAVEGKQVEPSAGYWADRGKRICVVEVDALPDDQVIPKFNCDPNFLEQEIAELEELQRLRDATNAIEGTFQGRRRLRLSSYFNLRPPLGSIIPVDRFNDVPDLRKIAKQCDPVRPMVRTGRELARLFESETPGLLHRHALNCLLLARNVSPPRQARIWMALDVTIYSALLAAWHYKWANIANGAQDRDRVFRERPIEYTTRTKTRSNGKRWKLQVLYDRRVDDDGGGDGPLLCPDPEVLSPGTPRHPAFPSGHSTYSAAASAIMAHFFPDQEEELEFLADNIGVARLWAGVHWRQDHVAGQQLGRAVAQRVIDQLQADPVVRAPAGPPMPCDQTPAPSFDAVRRAGRGQGSMDQDVIPPPRAPIIELNTPNRGA
jgi:membrane-associated phospholipid phosphatase